MKVVNHNQSDVITGQTNKFMYTKNLFTINPVLKVLGTSGFVFSQETLPCQSRHRILRKQTGIARIIFVSD
jgi:hypothetical protein